MNIDLDRHYMRLALAEAKKGLGRTSPNPCVGAVIVKQGEVIAKGYHKKAGTPHAEVHALRMAGEEAMGATMYVTLEPCNHTGKTPPCSHAVAAAGICRVVVGMEDPNPLVDGTGVEYLRQEGVEVVTGVLAEECRAINRPFIKHITTGLPWMVMKAGISLDGKLNYIEGKSGWITGEQSGRAVHRLRDTHDAIMVGQRTAAIDNPSLTTRLTRGHGHDPLRVILDSRLSLPNDARPYTITSQAGVIVFCSEDANRQKKEQLLSRGVQVVVVPSTAAGLDLLAVAEHLGRAGITSVLVEGGAALHGAMLRARLFDYAYLFIAPIFAGEKGISVVSGYHSTGKTGAVSIGDPRYKRLGRDMMVSGGLHYPRRGEIVDQ